MEFQQLVQTGLAACGCAAGVAIVVNSAGVVRVAEVGTMTGKTPMVLCGLVVLPVDHVPASAAPVRQI